MPSVPSYLYQTVLMGSDITLKFYQRQDKIAAQALLLVKHWEDRLTINRPAGGRRLSEIAAVNAAAGHRPVRVSPEVFTLLQQAQSASLYHGSCFNFAIGPIVKAWNIGFAQAHVPPPAKIAALLPLCDPRAVILNSADCSVFLPQSGMALDLGAIAKGFIADCVKDFLQKSGVKTALINLGGNIHSLGAPATANKDGALRQNWAVGLQKPFGGRHDLLGLIHIADKSVVTSGIYERYFISGGPQEQTDKRAYAAALAAALPAAAGPDKVRAEKAAKEAAAAALPAVLALPAEEKQQSGGQAAFYHHIFDPRSGYPLHNDLLSVTIIADKSVNGEIGSSLLYGFGLQKALEFLRCGKALGSPPGAVTGGGFAAAGAAETALSGIEAIFVTKDRRIILPSAQSFRFELLDKSYQLIEAEAAA